MIHPIPASAHPGVQAWHASRPLSQFVIPLTVGVGWWPDLSEFNGTVDWGVLEMAYQVGTIGGVIMRASFGTVRADRQFATNQREARNRGIPRAFYHFCYPAYNSAGSEATFFNNVVGPLLPLEAMIGDFEDDGPNLFPRGQAGLNWAGAFLMALEAPVNATWGYSYPSLISEVGLQPLWSTWPFWLADYGATPDSVFTYATLRQFTDCGSTPGVSGCCDQSRVLRAPMSQWLTPGGAPDPPPSPPKPKETPMIIRNTDDGAVYQVDAAGKRHVAGLEYQAILALGLPVASVTTGTVQEIPDVGQAPAVDVNALAASIATDLLPHLPPATDPAVIAAAVEARLAAQFSKP